MRRYRSPLLAAVALLASCAGAPTEPTASTSQPIINGVVDTTHPAVVALVHPLAGQFCSGTLIAPRAVLSAGHCIAEMQATFQQHGLVFSPTDCKAFFGTTVGQAGPSLTVSAAFLHPQYSVQSNGVPQNDLSIWQLAQDAPTAPLAWQQQPLGNLAGQSVTLVGYGVTDAAAQTGNGTRRTVDETVTQMDASFLYYDGGSSGTCQGDSGGPMLYQENGAPVVVGVTSAGDKSCVGLSVNTRVDPYANFIVQYAGASAQPSQPATVTIVTPVESTLLGSDFTVVADVSSPAGLYHVAVLVDGVAAETLTAPPWSFALHGLAPGAHEITVTAVGNDGGTGQAVVHVDVSASAPATCSSQSPCPTGYVCAAGACGPQPPAAFGGACVQDAHCQSGICLDATSGQGYCSQTCATAADCPDGTACAAGMCGRPLGVDGGTADRAAAGAGGGCQAGPGRAASALVPVLILVLLALLRRGPTAR